MFAGRYLWWTMIAIGGFVFFALYFDYAAWLFVQLSGCSKRAGSCGPLLTFLAGTVKPAGFWLVGGILFVCTLVRIRYLRFGYGWCLAAAVWFLAAVPFPTLFASLLDGQIRPGDAFGTIPVALLFLAALMAYLLIPFGEDGGPPNAGWRGFRRAAGVIAAYPTLLVLATDPRLVPFTANSLALPQLASRVAQLQRQTVHVLPFGGDDVVLGRVALLFFVALLLAGLLPDAWRTTVFTHLRRAVRGEQRSRRPRRVV